MHKTGITLIGLPGSGKTTLSRAVIKKLSGWNLHDHDDDGLESAYGLGKGGIAQYIEKHGDAAFLQYEENFTINYYSNNTEGKTFHFDKMLFASSGSIILSEKAIEYVRARTHTLLIDIPPCVALMQIQKRSDGITRIVGMNGGIDEKPRSASIEDELRFREGHYQKYADVTLMYHPWENLETTIERLYSIMQSIITP